MGTMCSDRVDCLVLDGCLYHADDLMCLVNSLHNLRSITFGTRRSVCLCWECDRWIGTNGKSIERFVWRREMARNLLDGQEAREWFSHALSCVKDMRLMFDDDDVTSVYEVVDACASTIEKLCLVLKGVYTLGSSQSKFLYSI